MFRFICAILAVVAVVAWSASFFYAASVRQDTRAKRELVREALRQIEQRRVAWYVGLLTQALNQVPFVAGNAIVHCTVTHVSVWQTPPREGSEPPISRGLEARQGPLETGALGG